MTIKSKRASKPNQAEKWLEDQIIRLAPKLAKILREPDVSGVAILTSDPRYPEARGLLVSPIHDTPPPSPESQLH